MKVIEIPPCAVHSPHPHAHPVITEAKGSYRKECSARWWCLRCGVWSAGDPCHRDRKPRAA